MSDLPVDANHFSGGRRLSPTRESEGGASLSQIVNALGQSVESAAVISGAVDLSALDAPAVKAASRGLSSTNGAAATVTLPDFESAPEGWEHTFRAVDGSSNTLTVQAAGSDTIDGAGSVALSADFASLKVMKVPGATEWITLR